MSDEYSIEWFKEVKRDNPKWLGNQAFRLMEHYEALEADNKEADRLLLAAAIKYTGLEARLSKMEEALAEYYRSEARATISVDSYRLAREAAEAPAGESDETTD